MDIHLYHKRMGVTSAHWDEDWGDLGDWRGLGGRGGLEGMGGNGADVRD